MKSLEAVKSRLSPFASAAFGGDFACGEVLIAAERHGDWLRVAGTQDLWGVRYSKEAELMVAQAPHEQQAEVEATSVWVPIDARS